MPYAITYKVSEVSESEMVLWHAHPYFGYSEMREYLDGNGVVQRYAVVHVLASLPPRAKRSVLAHEMFHVCDEDFFRTSVLWREAKAAWAGLRADPLGFVQAVGLSVTRLSRLHMYWDRITKNY